MPAAAGVDRDRVGAVVFDDVEVRDVRPHRSRATVLALQGIPLGEDFVDHYVRTRDWEIRQHARAVSNWELARYFDAALASAVRY